MRAWYGRAAFWTALLLVIGVHVFSLVHGVVFSRLWGDEAYNLTVAVNLAAGHGYASDGILTSGRFELFDPRVSTGPTVLLPIAGVIALGLEPVAAGRLVMALIYTGAVAAIGLSGWKIGRRGGLVVALAVPLAFDATNPDSPMQSPIDVIGEWPAAGLLALALVVVARRPWLAGLLLGIAVQAKLVAILSLPVLVLMLLITTAPLRSRIRDALVLGTMTVVPTLLFEGAKWLQLGPAGYIRWLEGFLDFLTLKKIPFLPWDKARALLDSWFIPSTWVVVAALLIGVTVTLLALGRFGWRAGLLSIRQGSDIWLVAACVLIAFVWAVWWFQSRADLIWIRHLFPGFVPAAAGLLAGPGVHGCGSHDRVAGLTVWLVRLRSGVVLLLWPSASAGGFGM